MRKILTILLGCICLLNSSNTILPYKQATKEATVVAKKFNKLMTQTVKKQFKKGGIVGVAGFCIKNSSSIVKNFNQSLKNGMKLKRVSLKNRNPNNYPLDNEKAILKAFDLLNNSSVYMSPITQIASDDIYKVYFPATLSQRSCKKCHGMKENINPKVLSMIQKNYPKDKALNHTAGDLRGAVVITVDLNKIKNGE